ncbi:MAG: MFS transporter [Pseudomonadota bacterium]
MNARNAVSATALSLISAQYFLYFGVMGVFLPYFNLYCYHLGFSGFQIGSLSAIRSLTMVVFSIMWGILADRYRARRAIYIGCHVASAVIWGGFLMTSDFSAMVFLTIAYGLFYAPLISFLEAFAMDALGSEKRHYGRLRAWGSISFIATVILVGRLIDARGTGSILGLILAGSLALAVVATGVRRLPQISTPLSGGLRIRAFLTPPIRTFLLCAFLMLFSHGAYYGFFSIHLEMLGFDKTFVGVCWAVASGAEILVMIFSRRIFERFSMDRVLLVSFAVAVLRWVVLAVIDGAAAIVLAQVLHAVTYGAFHIASILYVDSCADAAVKTVGQAINNAITYGLGLMAGFLFSGWMVAAVGIPGLFWISGGVAAAAGIIFFVQQRGEAV